VPEGRTLLVADAHIGKAVSFRRLGVPVPEATTGGTLDALDALLARHRRAAHRVPGRPAAFARAHAASTLAAVAAWRRCAPGWSWCWCAATTTTAPATRRRNGRAGASTSPAPARRPGLALCHHPDAASRPARYVLAGHLHPCVVLAGRGGDRLRLPCFHFGAGVGVLPAFGTFTGMHPCPGGRRPGVRGRGQCGAAEPAMTRRPS
jgi:hypothetical protein